jgi:sodium transport system ATP-binding protein
MIKVKGLTKQFGSFIAVDDLSFFIPEGQVFGLLGENGAGKTTTLRMMATMLQPSSGSIRIHGVNAVHFPEEARAHIGILFGGETGLYDRLTARENILYFARLNGMESKAANARVERLADQLEMTEYLDRRSGNFSKGMKQKVALARSIVHDPQVMLFDEPTAGLDVTAIRLVHAFIRELKEEGKTIVFSSHTMTEVVALCDAIGIIDRGKLIEFGSLKDLKNKAPGMSLEEYFLHRISEDRR